MVRVLFLFIVSIFIFSGCEVFNPDGEVPSYIAVDEIRVEIDDPSQGTASHSITDCWLYVNDKLIGTFEVPFKVPVLNSGENNVYIEPGIKSGGASSYRIV